MEQTPKPENGTAMQRKEPVFVVMITGCEHKSYWYHGWNGTAVNVIERPDHFIMHSDWVDNNTPYRMIDKGDADIVGRLTPNEQEELIFSERLAHDPGKEFETLMGKKLPDHKPIFYLPGQQMDNDLIADARRNIDDLDNDNEIAKALADIYGMRAALQAVMYWFNMDHVSTPEWIYELVASRINRSNAYGITNDEAALHYIYQWKKDFPGWPDQEKKLQFDHSLITKEREMLLRLADYVLGNFGNDRDYKNENVVTFVIRCLERYKRLRSGDLTKQLFDIEEYLEENFPDDLQTETAETVTALLMELKGRRRAMKDEDVKDSATTYERIKEVLAGGQASAVRNTTHEFTKTKLDGYEALMTFLEKEFPNEGKGDTASTVAMKLLLELQNYRKINKLQGMPLHPLLQKNEELAAFILKEFPNDPGRLGEEAPIDVAIRLLTEYAQGWNVAEGILHFLGWFTNLEHPFDFGTRHNPFNMVPLVKSFIQANRLPELRRDPAFYLNNYKKEKA
jgi:hypothetical protein